MLALLALGLVPGAWAGPHEGPRRVALVIGNSAYENIPTLPNPRRDAGAVADSLERLGFEVTRVLDGDQRAFEEALAAFGESRKSSDIALFYFAGHGIQVNGENYLLPTSVQAPDADAIIEQSLGLNEVRARLQDADPGLAIIILDSCRDNPFGPMVTQTTGETAEGISFRQGLAEMSGAAGMLIAYATQPGKIAYDGVEEHSPFTASLLGYLEEPGLEIRLMLGRVREAVVEKTRGAQVPWVEEAVLGEFYFSDRPAALAAGPVNGHDLAFWQSIRGSDEAGDYEAYLTEFPEGAFALLSANRLKALVFAAERAVAMDAKIESADLRAEDWRRIKNSLFWLGYYNGPLGGEPDPGVGFSIQAFQRTLDLAPSGKLTLGEAKQLHFSAASSLISMGERLADQIVFERARLRGIDRGISEIALPAYRELVQRLAGKQDREQVLAEARGQVEAMQRQLTLLKRRFAQASQQYLTVVAAAGAGYADILSTARTSHIRAGGTEDAAAGPHRLRRRVFLQHALDYAERGEIDEGLWIEELR